MMKTEEKKTDAPEGAPKPEAKASVEVPKKESLPTTDDGHVAKPELTDEEKVLLNAQSAQQEIVKLRNAKIEACIKEIDVALTKYGCELQIGHTATVVFSQRPRPQVVPQPAPTPEKK